MFTVKPHILVVDDDDRLRSLLQQYLQQEGYAVSIAADARAARHMMQHITCDLMILDIMMPGETGLQFMEQLRYLSDVPVMMLSAMGEAEDRIAGLEKGVDDYLPKPFEPKELILRVRAILSRHRKKSERSRKIMFGPYIFHTDSQRLFRDGDSVYITGSEAELLKLLVEQEGTPLSRDQLSSLLQAGENERTIDVQVNRLRRKIEENPRQPRYLQTVRGAGYVFHAG